MSMIILVVSAMVFLGWSLVKDRKKTKKSVKFAKNLFMKTFVDIIGVMSIIGFILAIIPENLIKDLLGGSNQMLSTFYGATIGAITIIPGFIAFPLAKSLVDKGAFLVSVAAFITTLTMVGIATYPIEKKYFGTKYAVVRNSVSFMFAILIALLMGVCL